MWRATATVAARLRPEPHDVGTPQKLISYMALAAHTN